MIDLATRPDGNGKQTLVRAPNHTHAIEEEPAEQMIENARKHEQVEETEPEGDEEEQAYQADDGQPEEPQDAEAPHEEAQVE